MPFQHQRHTHQSQPSTSCISACNRGIWCCCSGHGATRVSDMNAFRPTQYCCFDNFTGDIIPGHPHPQPHTHTRKFGVRWNALDTRQIKTKWIDRKVFSVESRQISWVWGLWLALWRRSNTFQSAYYFFRVFATIYGWVYLLWVRAIDRIPLIIDGVIMSPYAPYPCGYTSLSSAYYTRVAVLCGSSLSGVITSCTRKCHQ